jgi:hypothetical protein
VLWAYVEILSLRFTSSILVPIHDSLDRSDRALFELGVFRFWCKPVPIF